MSRVNFSDFILIINLSFPPNYLEESFVESLGNVIIRLCLKIKLFDNIL